MGSFAAFLRRAGIRVTGSDQNVYPPMSDVLKQAGVELISPYDATNLERIGGKPDLVVVGNVIGRSNPEMAAFMERGDVYVSLPEFMERHLLPSTRNLVVAGTHGKTTTSSLLAHVLAVSGKQPSYFIGGVSGSLPHSFHVEQGGAFFVLEGDEYDTAFWDKVPKFNHYLPNDVILTSVEFDHADIYADLSAVKQAFRGLISRIRPEGRLIACVETENVRELLKEAQVPVIRYAREAGEGVDYSFRNLRSDTQGIRFDVCHHGVAVDELLLPMPGEHNALNALSVWIECRQLGLSSREIRSALASFSGIRRRQEERGEPGGVLVIDDFAHHPTAVRETLAALADKYSGRRMLAVFEPRSATSRRKVFQKEYTEAFDRADEIFVAVAYDQSKIPVDQQFSSQELVEGLRARRKTADFFDTVDEGVNRVASRARPGDVIAVLSNGGFGGFIPKLLEQLSRH
jgi:UDP-N-acetylmuramate: L-alanyl-gamma-D-glutamyl-meso-diaminopimelate ligase